MKNLIVKIIIVLSVTFLGAILLARYSTNNQKAFTTSTITTTTPVPTPTLIPTPTATPTIVPAKPLESALPIEFTESFMNSCNPTGNSRAYCTCTLDYLEDELGAEGLILTFIEYQRTKIASKEMYDAVKNCLKYSN